MTEKRIAKSLLQQVRGIAVIGKRGVLFLLAAMLLAGGCNGGSSTTGGSGNGPAPSKRTFPLSSLETADIVANGHTLRVWVMDTTAKRAEGMMYLRDQDVTNDEGMVFVFPSAQPRSFWMRNTYISLDIAYLDASGTVLNIAPMQPLDETAIPSSGPAKYAVEVKRGTMARFGVQTGQRIHLPSGLTATE